MNFVKRVLAIVSMFFLSSCETIQNLPEGYVGPTSVIHDSSKRVSATKVQFFELVYIDKRKVTNSSSRTLGRNYGQGTKLEVVLESRAVPASDSIASVQGKTHVSAPILALGGNMFSIKGDIPFKFVEGEHYMVNGILSEDYSAIWLENKNTGHIVSEIIEKGELAPAERKRLDDERKILIAALAEQAGKDNLAELEQRAMQDKFAESQMKKIKKTAVLLKDCANRQVEDVTPTDVYAYAEQLHKERKYKIALQCFEYAADQDHVESMMRVGMMYEFGEGVAQNIIEAKTWYKRAELVKKSSP